MRIFLQDTIKSGIIVAVREGSVSVVGFQYLIEKRGMERMDKRILLMTVVITGLLVAGCATMSPRTKAGAQIGAILGGLGGAVIDKDNPWRGAVEGAAIGAILGGTIGKIVDNAALEAARRDATVTYSRVNPEKGWKEEVVAEPRGLTKDGKYKIIEIRYIQNGKVVKEEVKIVPVSEL